MVAEADLLSLLVVAGGPVPVEVAATALGEAPEGIIEAGERLVIQGLARDTAVGFELGPDASMPVGSARAAHLAARLADGFARAGADGSVTGPLLARAGRHADAFAALSAAALSKGVHLSDRERSRLLDAALEAQSLARIESGPTEGRLRLARARLRRGEGRSDEAAGDLEIAVGRLQGEELVDALGFAAAIEDDRQRPQDAERLVAMAELVAAGLGLAAKLGSLLTFHGRELSRIGFAREAEAALIKGAALVDQHGEPIQRFYARMNRAWVELDQGEVRKAEVTFARLREEAGTLEGEASVADKDAYWARTLFQVGRPEEASAAAVRAVAAAEASGAVAPLFIAGLADVEGALLLDLPEQALEAADRILELASVHLPAWTNLGRHLRARALQRLGRLEEARVDIGLALAATPDGINGMRRRLPARALAAELEETWDQRAGEDLTDALLQSRWMGAAVEVMITRAVKERDPELGGQAAALAMQLGNPLQAAKAVEAAGLWSDPAARPVAVAVRGVDGRIPGQWREHWQALPWVQHALAVQEEPDDEAVALLRARIDEALAASGLSGEMILSPAQRDAAGLIRRRPRRRPTVLTWAAAALGMVVLAGVASLVAVNVLTPPTTLPPTSLTTTTTAAPPALEETVVAAPEAGLNGTVAFRGDPSRSGTATGGFRTVTGRYWRVTPGGVVIGAPVAYGNYLFLATDENRVYGLQQKDHLINMTVGLGETLTTAPAVGLPPGSETAVLVVATADGVVHGYSALSTGPQLWEYEVGARVSAPLLVVEGVVYAAAEDGRVHAFDLGGGRPRWIYPQTGSVGELDSAPAYADGLVYVGDRAGDLHVIRADTGEPVCSPPMAMVGGEIAANPVLSNGVLFVSLGIGGIPVFEAGSCGALPAGYAAQYPATPSEGLAPAVDAGNLYLLEGRRLLAYLLDGAAWADAAGKTPSPWASPFGADDIITTPPVVADGVVYVGSQGGTVQAVDGATGELLWSFNTGSGIRGEPVVVPQAVFVATASGELWAIAGE